MARTCVLGRSGTGKSWFSGKVLEDILTDGDGSGRAGRCGCEIDDCDHSPGEDEYVPTIETGEGAPDFDTDEEFEYAVHIDIEDEERGFSDAEDPVLLTYTASKDTIDKYVTFGDDPPSYIPEEELETGPEILLPKWVLYKNKYIRVVPEGLTDEEKVMLVEMMADAAMKAGDCHFSVDEAHLIARKHNIGDKLMRLVTGGRKRGVEWLIITQRPQKLHEDILSQSDYTVYFELRNRDRDKAAEKAESIPDAEDRIATLGERQAIIEDFDQGSYTEFSTNELEREIPHVSGDDGKADSAYDSLMGESDATVESGSRSDEGESDDEDGE